jgi:Fuc2NAc and GlcNAc transferase
MSETLLLVAVLIAAYFGTSAVRTYALARQILDVPNARSSHTKPTPRGGGVAIVVAFLAGLVVLWALGRIGGDLVVALLIGGGLVAAVGFWDDQASLPPHVRLGFHFLASALVIYWLGGLPHLDLGFAELELGWLGYAFGTLGLVWLLNLYNFMDGIDGLAASEAIFVAGAGALLFLSQGDGLALAMALLAASSAGFLLLNWPPARIFMGDAGSGFLGIALGVLFLDAMVLGSTSIWPLAILLGVFLVDATVTLVRRAQRGERVYVAHRGHAYQRAARRYGSHRLVTLSVTGINLSWLLPWAVLATVHPIWAIAATAAALGPLIGLAVWLGAGDAESMD